MYKHLLIAVIFSIFTGCSAPKPKHPPAWYTSAPKDFKYFYATASADTLTLAKNKAIIKLRKQIQDSLDSNFTDKKTSLKISEEFDINSILKENEHFVNTMSFITLKIDKTAEFKGEQLILIKLSRKSIFDKLNIIASKKIKESKESYKLIKDNDILIKKYSILNNIMKDYAKLASLIEAKRVIINSHNNSNDIKYLNELNERYLKLKNKLSIYVLSDINSRIYVQAVKDALKNAGIELSSEPKSDKSLKLYITSKTENMKDYGFKKSKSLVKYSTYDLNKNRVLFRQHTFSAKSRKGYSDAKAQTAIHEMSKIRKLGIFDFLGVK